MATLTEAARRVRIAAHRATLKLKLAHRIIDTSKPAFADLVSDKGKPMSTLNGEIILERDLREDGSLKGVISIHPDELSAMLPDLKADVDNKMGWKKYLDRFYAESAFVLEGVPNPSPADYK